MMYLREKIENGLKNNQVRELEDPHFQGHSHLRSSKGLDTVMPYSNQSGTYA